MDKGEEIRQLKEELAVVRKSHTIEMPLMLPREGEEGGTRPIAEVYNMTGYIKGGEKEEKKVEETAPTSIESGESEDVRMEQIICKV